MEKLKAACIFTVLTAVLPVLAESSVYTGSYPVISPVAGEPDYFEVPSQTIAGNAANYHTNVPPRFAYSFPTPPVGSGGAVTFSDDFSITAQNPADWVRYYGEPNYFTSPANAGVTSRWTNWNSDDSSGGNNFTGRNYCWTGHDAIPDLAYQHEKREALALSFEQRTFNRTTENILRLGPWHAEQNQPWDWYQGSMLYDMMPQFLSRSAKEYNFWSNSSQTGGDRTTLWNYLYILQRDLPVNFEYSFTLIRHGSWGGFGLILGPSPRHLPGETDYGYRTGSSGDPAQNNDNLPIALEDTPAAVAYFQQPEASTWFAKNWRTVARWKEKAFLRPLFLQDSSNTPNGVDYSKFLNKGWNPELPLPSRAAANGTSDTGDTALSNYGKGWPYLYSLRPGTPYRVSMARINGVIYLTVQEIGPDADPTNWIRYKSTDKDPNGLGKSSGNSPTLPTSASTLPAAAGQRLMFWVQDHSTNSGYAFASGSRNNPLEAGEETEANTNGETTFDGAIDDVVLRDLGGGATEANLTPVGTDLPTLTATPTTTQGFELPPGNGVNADGAATRVVYVSYHLTNNGTTTAQNIQFMVEGSRWSNPSNHSGFRRPIAPFDYDSDLPLNKQAFASTNGYTTWTGDTLCGFSHDTRPWSVATDTIGTTDALVATYIASLAPGASRDIRIAWEVDTDTWQLPDNTKVYLTAGPQNTRVATVSNAWADPSAPQAKSDLDPTLTPESQPPAIPTKPTAPLEPLTSNDGRWILIDGNSVLSLTDETYNVKFPIPREWDIVTFVFGGGDAFNPKWVWQYKPAKPRAGYDGVTGPYGAYDWAFNTDPMIYDWDRIPYDFGTPPKNAGGVPATPNISMTSSNIGPGPYYTRDLVWSWKFEPWKPTPTPSGGGDRPSPNPTKFGKRAKVSAFGERYLVTIRVTDKDVIKTVTVNSKKAKARGHKYSVKLSFKPKKITVIVTDKAGGKATKKILVK